jgi:hypothetical protein
VKAAQIASAGREHEGNIRVADGAAAARSALAHACAPSSAGPVSSHC